MRRRNVPFVPFRRPSLSSVLPLVCGVLLGLCGLPLGWSALTPLPLALSLWVLANGASAGRVAGRPFWLISLYFAMQLWWLTRFMADLSGLPWGGVLVLPLFAVEGAFWAGMAWLVTRPLHDPLARVWALAGGWVLLEWLRTLGPLAFPWSELGYTLLPTPLAQTADLWGERGLSLLVAFTAASLVSLAWRRPRPVLLAVLLWAGGWAYGATRVNSAGPEGRALLLRTRFDSFGRATKGNFSTCSSSRASGSRGRPWSGARPPSRTRTTWAGFRLPESTGSTSTPTTAP